MPANRNLQLEWWAPTLWLFELRSGLASPNSTLKPLYQAAIAGLALGVIACLVWSWHYKVPFSTPIVALCSLAFAILSASLASLELFLPTHVRIYGDRLTSYPLYGRIRSWKFHDVASYQIQHRSTPDGRTRLVLILQHRDGNSTRIPVAAKVAAGTLRLALSGHVLESLAA